MKFRYPSALTTGLVGFLLFANPAPVSAQSPQSTEGKQPAVATNEANAAESARAQELPVNSEEESEAKEFLAVPASDFNRKIEAGEQFLKKYPQSRLLPSIYSTLTFVYLRAGRPDKAFEIGDKEVQLRPDDVETLALLSLTIPRAVNSKTPDPDKQLAKAENYARRAIEVTPTLVKPEGITDQNFVISKNATLSMAHGGLGLVYFREAKFKEAIPELEQSIKIDPNPSPDPTNLYALALSDQKASHFEDAAAAYIRCAAIAGTLQSVCRDGAEQAKKQSTTQLSAPRNF
jgi:tetratricopeptide (TPR) repeat protein